MKGVAPPPGRSAVAHACRRACEGAAIEAVRHPTLAVSREGARALIEGAVAEHLGGEGDAVVWRDLESELVVHPARTRADLHDGFVLITLLVHSEETGTAEILVPFAVGTADRAAGLLAATEPKPRGPDLIVERWGDALIAVAWRALLTVARELAVAAGDGKRRFAPAALSADRGGLRLILEQEGER